MTYSLKTELVNELNIIKGFLREAEKTGEINQGDRVKIMNSIGQIKSVLYSDCIFKNQYTLNVHKIER